MNTNTQRKMELMQRLNVIHAAQENGKIDSGTWFILCSEIIAEYPDMPEIQNKLAAILLETLN